MDSFRALARSLGVSPATVSRALAGRPHVREAVRTRILAAAAAAGLAAPGVVRSGGRRLVAVVARHLLTGPAGPRLADLLGGATQGARQAGATLAVEAFDGPEPSDLPALRARSPSALLLCLWNDPASAAALARAWPTVAVGQPPADPPPLRWASFDAAHGVRLLIAHLRGLGHRRIAFLGDAASGWRGRERSGAALAAAADLGVEVALIRTAGGRGWERVRRAISAGTSGWIGDTQATCAALLRRCAGWGIAVPRTVSVCGFHFADPLPGAPRITGMRGDWRAVGRIAARWALTRPDPLDPGLRLLVHSQLEPGDTTAPLRRREA